MFSQIAGIIAVVWKCKIIRNIMQDNSHPPCRQHSHIFFRIKFADKFIHPFIKYIKGVFDTMSFRYKRRNTIRPYASYIERQSMPDPFTDIQPVDNAFCHRDMRFFSHFLKLPSCKNHYGICIRIFVYGDPYVSFTPR